MNRTHQKNSPLRASLRQLTRGSLFCGLISFLTSISSGVAAQTADYGALAVQNRQYESSHELTIAAGFLPIDAFTKGVTLGGAYTLHFSSLFAWEVIHVANSFSYETNLREKLRREGNLEPVPFETLKRTFTSALVLKPLYWKGALSDTSVVHGEFFLTAGGGLGFWTRSRRPEVMVGGGFRIYLSRLFSVRLDVRDQFFFFDEFELEQELWVGLGCSLSL